MHDAASLCKGEASQNIQLIDVSSMAVRTTSYFEHLTFCQPYSRALHVRIVVNSWHTNIHKTQRRRLKSGFNSEHLWLGTIQAALSGWPGISSMFYNTNFRLISGAARRRSTLDKICYVAELPYSQISCAKGPT